MKSKARIVDPPRRRHELFIPLSNDLGSPKQCFSLTSSSDWTGSIVQNGSSPAYGVVFLPNGQLWKLPHSSEAVSALSLYSTSADFSYAAVGTTRGNINIYLLDKRHGVVKTWLGGRPTTEEITALKFVTPAERTVLFSLVVLTKKSGSLLMVDVLLDTVNADDDSIGDASVFSVEGADEPDTDMVTYQVQSSLRLVDQAVGEKPTGAILIMDHETDPRVLLGMTGGTLLVLGRVCDKIGYSWMPVKKILLPSGIASLALSSDCVDSPENYTLLAAGLKDGEVALLDATLPTHQACSPPFPPFHFLAAHEDYFMPVSALSFFWSSSRLLLAVGSGNLLRITDMSTFETFYAYKGSLGTIQDVQFMPGTSATPMVLVAREMYAVEKVTFSPWKILFGGSLLQPAPVTSVAFTGESNCLAVSSGSDVLVCDSSTWLPASNNTQGTVFDKLQLDANTLVKQVAYSPDSRVLAIVTKPKDAPDGDASLCLYTRIGIHDSWEPKVKHTAPSKDPTIAFSPTYRYLLMTKDDGFIVFDLGRMHDLGKVATEKNFGDILIEGRRKAARVLAGFSNDGRTLAVARNSWVKFYDGERMVETGFIDIEKGKISSLSFGAKSTQLAIGSTSGDIFVAEYCRGEWVMSRSLQCPEGVLSAQFSPNSASPFIAAVTGSPNCYIFSTLSWEIVQAVPFDGHCQMKTLTFDRSGTLLVVGGLTSSAFGKLNGGVTVVVHVGEVLCPKWFVTPFDHNKPGNGSALCHKLASLHTVERSQLLYHKTDGEKLLPLESAIRSAVESITSSKSSGALRGSVRMSFDSPMGLIASWLKDLFLAFPKAVFSCTASFGSIVDAAVLREDQRLLGLVMSTALIKCRSHPYLMMNFEMRTSRLTDALVATAKFVPDCLLDIIHEVALWPAPLYAQEEWKAPAGGRIVHRALEIPMADEAFKEVKHFSNGVLARPFVMPIPGLSALKFLSSLTRSCGPEAFTTQEIAIVLDGIWSMEIMPMFLVDCFLQIGLFVTFECLISGVAQAAEFQSFSSLESNVPTGSIVPLIVLTLVCNCLITVRTVGLVWSCRSRRIDLADHSLARVLQHTFVVLTWLMVNVTLFLYVFCREWIDNISAVTSFLLLVNTLELLRGFECVDWLFHVLWQIIMDLKGFALVAGTILIWLAVAFRSLPSAFFEQIELTWCGLSLCMPLVAVLMSVYISVLQESCAQTQHYVDSHKRYKRACLIVSYLEHMNKERREVMESLRNYLFVLIPIEFADTFDDKGAPRLIHTTERYDLRKREEDRRQHKQSQMLERQVKTLCQMLHEVDEKVTGLYNSSEANLDDDMSARWTDTASIQSRTSFQKRIGPLSQW